MSTKPGVTRRPSASIVRVASSSIAPMPATRPSRIATSAVRAVAPVPSTTVPPLMSRSSIVLRRVRDAVEVERVEAVERLSRGVGQLVVVLTQLIDHAGVLRVVVREVGRPDVAVDTDQWRERTRGALAGVEADPALALEI